MKDEEFQSQLKKENFSEDIPTEVRLIEAERAIERIEKLFSGDPLEKISHEAAAQAASSRGEKKSFFLIRWWKSWKGSSWESEKLSSMGLLLGVAGVSFGIGGLVGAMGFSFYHSNSHRAPVAVEAELEDSNEYKGIEEESLDQPAIPAKTINKEFLSKEEAVVETKKPWAAATPVKSVISKPADLGSSGAVPSTAADPVVPKPVASPSTPAAVAADAVSAAAKPSAPPNAKTAPVSNAARDQAIQEINFANEVIGSLRSSAGAGAIAQADKSMARAKELMDAGKFAEAGKLARETAEQLLIGAP